jgi:hypothetical protein
VAARMRVAGHLGEATVTRVHVRQRYMCACVMVHCGVRWDGKKNLSIELPIYTRGYKILPIYILVRIILRVE